FTASLASGVRPLAANSSTSGGNSCEQTFIWAANSSDTTLTTNSPVASILRSVSFLPPSLPRIMGEKQTTGGLALMPVKQLIGQRLRMRPVMDAARVQRTVSGLDVVFAEEIAVMIEDELIVIRVAVEKGDALRGGVLLERARQETAYHGAFRYECGVGARRQV